MNLQAFQKELTELINKHSIENGSNTPDFILGQFLMDCLLSFNKSNQQREKWYGREISDTANQPTGSIETPKIVSTIKVPGVTQGKSLAELYQKDGGIPIKKRYIDEIKERDQQ